MHLSMHVVSDICVYKVNCYQIFCLDNWNILGNQIQLLICKTGIIINQPHSSVALYYLLSALYYLLSVAYIIILFSAVTCFGFCPAYMISLLEISSLCGYGHLFCVLKPKKSIIFSVIFYKSLFLHSKHWSVNYHPTSPQTSRALCFHILC